MVSKNNTYVWGFAQDLKKKDFSFLNNNKKRHNATKPGFQRFNQVLMWQEEEMKVGSEEKMMPFFWLHWLHAPSLVSIG